MISMTRVESFTDTSFVYKWNLIHYIHTISLDDNIRGDHWCPSSSNKTEFDTNTAHDSI